MQAVVDRHKRFIDVAVRMPSSTYDSRMLHGSSLYQMAKNGTLFEEDSIVDGFTPFLLGNAGYPLKLYLMIPYHNTPGRRGDRSMIEQLHKK